MGFYNIIYGLKKRGVYINRKRSAADEKIQKLKSCIKAGAKKTKLLVILALAKKLSINNI